MNVSKVTFKTKMLVAAIAMAAAGAANALDMPATAGVGSELVFSIWDPTVGQEASFTLGLDLNMNTFSTAIATAPGYTVNFGNIFANTEFQQYLGAGSNGGANSLSALRWNVAAGYNEITDQEKIVITHGPVGGSLNLINDQAQQGATAMANFFFEFGASNSGGSDGVTPKYAGDSVRWGESAGGAAFQGTAGSVGDSLGFYQFTNTVGPDYLVDGGAPAAGVVYQNQYGFGAFTLTQTGDLIYTAPAVPVPAAVWLLGSAMIGLVGVARRRNSGTA